MFKEKNKSLYQTTWSEMMLKEFLDRIYPGRMPICDIPLLIKERVTATKFNLNEPTAKSVKYRGFLAMEGLENAGKSLGSDQANLLILNEILLKYPPQFGPISPFLGVKRAI
jgi:hypothetical protein